MSSNSMDYEQLRSELGALSSSINENDRKTLWVVNRVFGIAKTSRGAIELFLIGDKLVSTSSLVKRHLEFGRWQIADEHQFIDANRIVLPSDPHFLPLAATIGVELMRVGLKSTLDLQFAFKQVEPLIELALRRSALAEEHILGLIGELLCLECMLDAVPSRHGGKATILDMWRGYTKGLRDFVIGGIALEVKTTQLETSSHKFSGLHQVELQTKAGSEESALYLLSVGLAPSASEGISLSSIVERIVKKLADQYLDQLNQLGPLQQRFLSMVSSYGSESAVGYDHMTMSQEVVYNLKFRPTFSPRLYDLHDTELRIIRSSDLDGTCVSTSDFQFRLDLDSTITAINPAPNWTQAISDFVRTELFKSP